MPLNPDSASSCDRPYIASEGELRGEPQLLRVDQFYDQDMRHTLMDASVGSSVTFSPRPDWNNVNEVLTAAGAVSETTVVERPYDASEGLESLIRSSEQSAGLVGYAAARPVTYTYSVQCLNDQQNDYRLVFDTWSETEFGILDCELRLDAKAQWAAQATYDSYCQAS
ncbi:MAG: hypothetical protein ACTIMV_04635 [Glutamicibacter arilaitensis]